MYLDYSIQEERVLHCRIVPIEKLVALERKRTSTTNLG
jgi:hypothetical protein